MATHAQVANDLFAQGAYFGRSDRDIERLCSDAAHLIRSMLAGEAVDGRTYNGVHTRLVSRVARCPTESQIERSLSRGLRSLQELQRERIGGK